MTFELARNQLTALDLKNDLETIASATHDRAEIQAAIARGRKTMLAIGQKIAAARANEPSPADRAAAGNALLEGKDVPRVDVDALIAERKAVELAIADLRARDEALAKEIGAMKRATASRLAEAAEPALGPLREMAAMGVDLLLGAYGGAKAVHEATGNGTALTFAHSLEQMLAEATAQRHVQRKPIPVPKAVRDLLRKGATAIGQLERKAPDSVPMPQSRINAPLVSLTAAALR